MLPKDKNKIKEYKKNISLRMLGNKNPLGAKRTKEHIEIIKKTHTGRKLSDYVKEKISKSRRGKCCGKDNGSWKGGVTTPNVKIRCSTEYKDWRKAVFEKDNYTCVLCGNRSKSGNRVYLNADHIKPFALFPKLRLDVNNGRTLCVDCHKKTDTYGWKLYNDKKI